MVPFLYFLLFLSVLLGVAFGLTAQATKGALSAAGPARVGAALSARNRAIGLFFLVVLVIVAVLEALLTDVSDAILGLQYAFGDAVGADPVLVYETSMGSVSWGLYLAVLLGVALGLVGGTLAATRRYPLLRSLGPSDVI